MSQSPPKHPITTKAGTITPEWLRWFADLQTGGAVSGFTNVTINRTTVGGSSISVETDANDLIGDTLAPNVLFSSLTSVGALTSGSIGPGFTIDSGVAFSGSLPWANLPSGVGSWSGVPTISGTVTLEADLLPSLNYTGNLGSLTKKFLAVYAAELWVETLVAADVMATIGGRVVVAPTTTLTLDAASADTTITVKHNNLRIGHRVRLEANGSVEWMAITSGAGGAASYVTEVLADTPAVFLRLGDASGTVAQDSTANDRDGTIVGSPVLGAEGPCADGSTVMTFDGVNDYVNVADGADVDATGDFSIECWFKTGTLVDANVKLFWKRLGGNGYGLHITTATGLLTFECETGSSNNQLDTTVTNYIDGVWHHVVATRSGANGSIYVDGALVAGPTALTSNSLANTAVLRIGSNDAVSRRFVGTAGNFAFYGSALSGARILAHYAARLAGTVGAYVYTVTRNLDGSGANAWLAGDAVLNTGTTGDGFIDLYSVSGVFSGLGPTIVGNVRTGTDYEDVEPRWAIGNLNGLYGYATDLYGAAFGDESNTNLVIDADDGLRIRQGTTDYVKMAASLFRLGLSGGNRVEWDGADLTIVSEDLTIDDDGIRLGASAAFNGPTAYKFTREAGQGHGQAGDIFAMWTSGVGSSTFFQIENTIKGLGAGAGGVTGKAQVVLLATGWDNTGAGSSTTPASMGVRSEIGISYCAIDATKTILTGTISERGRANDIGEFVTVAFDAANFSGNGAMTWVVASGNQTTFAYKEVGTAMTVAFRIVASTVGGTANTTLSILIPNGKTAQQTMDNTVHINQNGVESIGRCFVNATGTVINIVLVPAGNWTLGTVTAVRGQIEFEVDP